MCQAGKINRLKSLFAVVALAMSLLAAAAPHALGSHDTSGTDPVINTPEVWRGWVGMEETYTAPYQHISRGWWVDGAADSLDVQWHGDIYWYAANACSPSGNSAIELAGDQDGSGHSTIGHRDDLAVLGTSGPGPGEGLQFSGGGLTPDIQLSGVQQDCSGRTSPYGISESSFMTSFSAAAHVDLSAVPTTVASRYHAPGDESRDYEVQVCMTRSTVDADGDQLPDEVDLDPLRAAPLTDLGVPGGPSYLTIPAKLEGGPSGKSGVPSCPADRGTTGDLSFDWKVKSRTKDKDKDGVIDRYVAGGAQSGQLEPQQPITVVLDACEEAGRALVTWTVEGTAISDGGPCRFEWATTEGTYQIQVGAVVRGVPKSGSRLIAPEHHVVVGLGDSYGSGEGAPRGAPVVSKSYWDQKTCHRSANAAQARAALKLEKSSTGSAVTFVHLACSGATVDAGILGPFKGQTPQILDAVSRTSGNDVDAVLLSIGGNDIGFSDVIKTCLLNPNCPLERVVNPDFNSIEDVNLHEATQYHLSRLSGRYERVAACLSEAARSCDLASGLAVDPAKIFHTEYPDLTRDDDGDTCDNAAKGVHKHELAWADSVIANGHAGDVFRFQRRLQPDVDLDVTQNGLNTQILAGGSARGWSPVDGIIEASSTHGYCARNHWIVRLPESVAIQGDKNGAFHPNNKGQKAYGSLIAAQLEATL